jgi:exosortase E/protease (VPEID-CTERM system)
MTASEPTPACRVASRPPLPAAEKPSPRGARPVLLALTWALLTCLLMGEILFLTIRHDAGRFALGAGRLSGLVALMPVVLRIALSVFAAALALAVWRLRHNFRSVVRERGLVAGLWPWLVLHLAAFVILEHLSGWLFEGPMPPDEGVVLLWMMAASCTGLFWLAAMLPPRFWTGVIRSGRGSLVMGLLIGLAAWSAGYLTRSGWEAGAWPTFWAAGGLLRLVYPVVVSELDSFVLGTPAFQVTIDPACAGYEGIGLVCLYVGIYLILFRHELRFPLALWLLPAGAVAAWMLNVIRIVVLIAIGDSISPALALGGFHSQAGWLGFNVVALGLIYGAHRSRFVSRSVGPSGPSPTTAYLAPLLVLVLTQMLTIAFFNDSPALYPLRVLAAGVVLACCWRSIDWLGSRPTSAQPEKSGWGIAWALLAGTAVFAMWLGLGIPSVDRAPDPREALVGSSAWFMALWLVFRVAGSVVVIPLVEEVAFRGYLLRRLVARDFRDVTPGRLTMAAVLISSLLFGLLHNQWFAGTLAGLAYAAVYSRRGRVADAVIAHATTNGLITLAALTTGQWSLWS